jgi:hypothetical protein
MTSKAYYYTSRAIVKRSGRAIVKRVLLFNGYQLLYKWLLSVSGFQIKWIVLLLLLL